MLVLVLLIHLVYGRDPQLDYPVFKNVSSCPEAGYFLRGERGENLIGQQCYLCFCDGSEAMCWKHQNLNCDSKSYTHYRKIRSRRSPGFADLFFQDAARDIFTKQTPEECKPFQSSYSVGCPPVDWCIGCTVCDCNANGRWDCHVLSFCPGDKGKKRSGKKKRTVINAMKMKPSLRNATPIMKQSTKKNLPIKPTPKRSTQTKQPPRKYMPVQSKVVGTTSIKSTIRKKISIQSKVNGTVPTKPTTRRNMPIQPKIKETVPKKPTTRRNMPVQSTVKGKPTRPTTRRTIKPKITKTKPTSQKSIQMQPKIKRTMTTKPVLTRTTTLKALKNKTVNKRQINFKPQNVNETKTKMKELRLNTKPRTNKTNNSILNNLVNISKPVQKKTITTHVKPALRSFQKVTGKPITSNVNTSKILINTAVVKNISSKFIKSAEKIINEKQKKLSKVINNPEEESHKNNFKGKLQKNVTIFEMTNKMKEKVITAQKNGITRKRLYREK